MRTKVKPHKHNYAKSKENELTTPWSILGEKRSQNCVRLRHPTKPTHRLQEQLQSVILGSPLPWRQQQSQLSSSTSTRVRLLILYSQNLDYTQRLKRREKNYKQKLFRTKCLSKYEVFNYFLHLWKERTLFPEPEINWKCTCLPS